VAALPSSVVRRLPLLVLIAVALTACGGSKHASTTSTSTTTADTPAEFVSAANNVCIAADRRIFKIGRLSRDPKGWARTAAAAHTAVTEMQRITPPPARADAFQQMLRYAKALVLTIQNVHDALVKSDLDTAAAAQLAAGKIQDKVHTAAKAVGLTFCQQPLTNWPA
jgi:hypothetical protein